MARSEIWKLRSKSLQAIRAVSDSCRFTCQTIEAAVLQSVALDRQGSTDDAFDSLDEALALAESGGWVRPFFELGQPMASLLQRAPLENVSIDFVDRLLETFPEIPSAEDAEVIGAGEDRAFPRFNPVLEVNGRTHRALC